MKARKRLAYIIVAIFVILFAGNAAYRFPRRINKEFNGIMYKLGDSSYSQPIKVKINCSISKDFLMGDKLQGTITIGDKRLHSLNIRFANGGATLNYLDENNKFKYYGVIISKNLKEGFTICVSDQNGGNSAGGSWNSGSSFMISAPAESREEALKLSNELMKDQLTKELE